MEWETRNYTRVSVDESHIIEGRVSLTLTDPFGNEVVAMDWPEERLDEMDFILNRTYQVTGEAFFYDVCEVKSISPKECADMEETRKIPFSSFVC